MGAEIAFSAGSGLHTDVAMLPTAATPAHGGLINIERAEALITITPPLPTVAALRAGTVNHA